MGGLTLKEQLEFQIAMNPYKSRKQKAMEDLGMANFTSDNLPRRRRMAVNGFNTKTSLENSRYDYGARKNATEAKYINMNGRVDIYRKKTPNNPKNGVPLKVPSIGKQAQQESDKMTIEDEL